MWLPTGIKLMANDKDVGLFATFKRCMLSACFADVDARDDVIQKFRAIGGPAKLQFKDGSLKAVSLPASFAGFNAAYEAMLKD